VVVSKTITLTQIKTCFASCTMSSVHTDGIR
jgi:hypothetical protein